MKTELIHSDVETILTVTVSTEKEKKILHHLMFGLSSPTTLKSAISASDTDFANSLTETDLQAFRDTVSNPLWRGKPIENKTEVNVEKSIE